MRGSKAKTRRPRHLIVGVCLVVILAVWIASGWISAFCQLGNWNLYITGGQLYLGHFCIDPDRWSWPVLHFMRSGFYWDCSIDWGAMTPLCLPLWIPFLTVASIGIAREVYWRRFRKPDPDHCSCGYPTAGLARCPECGREQASGDGH